MLIITGEEPQAERVPLSVGGIFTFEHVRNGKIIDAWEQPNLVVDEGLTYILGSSMYSTSHVTSWYLGLFKNNYTPLAANVMSTFPGSGVANEATTEYDESTREAWTVPGVSSKALTNSASPATFTFNTTVSIYGAFLSSSSTKGGTTGTLAAASKFASVRNMLSGDLLNVTYELAISSS